MAPNTAPIFELVPIVQGVQLAIGDTTAKKTLITGAAEGTRVDAIFCSTDDTAAVNLNFYINTGSVDYYLGVVDLPAGSGYTTISRVDAMSVLSPVLGYLVVPSGYTLKVSCAATMTTGKTTDVVALGGNY